jgi:hypothetical protein|nr:MAG TPA: hypothetical protein [Caudoviricetes sp.]
MIHPLFLRSVAGNAIESLRVLSDYELSDIMLAIQQEDFATLSQAIQDTELSAFARDFEMLARVVQSEIMTRWQLEVELKRKHVNA